MFCQQCGKQIEDTARFCRYCGAPQTPEAADGAPRKTPNPDPLAAPIAPRQSGKDVRIPRKVLIGGVLGLVMMVGAAVIVLGGGINGVFDTSPDRSVAAAGTANLPAQSQSAVEPVQSQSAVEPVQSQSAVKPVQSQSTGEPAQSQSTGEPAQDGTASAEAVNYQGDGVYTSTDGSWQCNERRMQGYFRGGDVFAACTSKAVTYNSGYSGWAISADLSEEFRVQLTLADSVEPQRTYTADDLIGVGKGAPGDLKLYDLRIENTHPVYSVMNPYYTLSTLSSTTENDAKWCGMFDNALVTVDFVDAERSMLGGTLSFEGLDSNGEPVDFSGCFVAPLPTGTAPTSSHTYHWVDTTIEGATLPEKTTPDSCKICHGTGDCVVCGGVGYELNGYAGDGSRVDCPCNGGRCSACGGTGLDN